MRALVWFRSDIRIDDNPSLKFACMESDEVHAIYIFSNRQMEIHDEANVKVEFIIQNLFALEKKLTSINIPLTIIHSNGFEDNADLIKQYSIEHSVNKVFWNNQFGEDELKRDRMVINNLKELGIESKQYNDQVIYAPGSLKTSEGKPYSVFTPFKKKWIENFKFDYLDIEFKYEKKLPQKIVSNIKHFDFKYFKNHKVNMELWKPGEDEAFKKLKNFLNAKVLDYSKNRNDPNLNGTSRISPYLSLGVISSRRCILEALKKNNFEFISGELGITKWIDEIIWREFYKNIMFSFPKVSKGQPFQDYSKKIKWRFNESEFNSWKNGMTGFPIIDAAMRQLQNEGWMHNRLRMVVAMFFTKNMLHDWRLGEKFFMQNLIDGDFSSNNGGWQWSSSTGTDAAPYFRIFNPTTQSINFDKEGKFIKKYLPELNNFDESVIHSLPSNHRKYSNYPEPILDLKYSRLRAIEVFKNAKN